MAKQNNNMILRLSDELLADIDESIKTLNSKETKDRQKFIRRSVRYCIDNLEDFKSSESATIDEGLAPAAIAKINAVTEDYETIGRYISRLKLEDNPKYAKQLAILLGIMADMIFKMNDPV